MPDLVAHKTVNGEEIHFVLVEECYSDNEEPFTLFINTNHYSPQRAERARKFFWSLEAALDFCHSQYGLEQKDWQSEARFTQDFHFEYGVTNHGVPQPFVVGFEGGQVIFKLGETEWDGERQAILNVSGNPDGLRRLAALLLLCAEAERYDSHLHFHLDDERFVLTDLPVTLRSPVYFEPLAQGLWSEGSVKRTITVKRD